MTLLEPFNVNLTNSYAGDAFSELVRVYNQHTHSAAVSSNFLTYSLDVDTSVGFVGIAAALDPFNGIGAPTQLKVVSITATTVTLSRPASATTTGTLSYLDPATNQFKLIEGLIATVGLTTLEFDRAVDRAGLISSSLVDLSLTRYVVNTTSISNSANLTVPLLNTTAAYTVDVNILGQYSFVGTTNPALTLADLNPKLTLTRGQAYTFTPTALTVTSGGFNIVSDLVEPKLGLKLYTSGIATNATTETIAFVVPQDAPSQLFYQSQSSPYTYGTIQVIGGVVGAVSVARDNATIAVPATAPDRLVILTLSFDRNYRITKWEACLDWTSVTTAGSVYLQLQANGLSDTPVAISELVEVNTVGTVDLSNALTKQILDRQTQVSCAVYSASGLDAITQQLTILDLIDP